MHREIISLIHMAASAYSDVALLGLKFSQNEKEEKSSQKVPPNSLGEDTIQAPVDCIFDSKAPCICSHEDFIVFSEFSEVQGPLPILTIPSYIQDNNVIDMNAFILKIMSVDYQANPSQFTICKDVELMQVSVMPGMHTYAHYFTLYDIKARGFVRPMCLAYVTRDERKLESNFNLLREQFLKMTDLMKFNNRQIFLEELIFNLHGLKAKQEMYFQLKKDQEELAALRTNQVAPGSPGIQPLVQQYTEYRHLQHIIESALQTQEKELQQILSSWEAAAHNSCQKEMQQFLKIFNQASTRMEAIRPVLAISPWGCLAALWGLSFHSARESVTFSSSDDSQKEVFQETDDEEHEFWSGCLWSNTSPPSPRTPGAELWKLFTGFPQAAQHLIYAILSGRTLVLAGTSLHHNHILSLIRALRPLLPPSGSLKSVRPILKWHQGILVAEHIQKYSMIGLCVPERLSVHDLLSAKDKNSVMILEVEGQLICGPAYAGDLLAVLEPTNCAPLVAAGVETILLLLQTVLAEVISKVHLARSLQTSNPPGVKDCDLHIIRYLASTLPPLW
ncbi:hypothetical protein B566_EDAN014070 [Ephemera danica]|nr:hypothetical protein B566_EDAN014070 [Ephemera danica]